MSEDSSNKETGQPGDMTPKEYRLVPVDDWQPHEDPQKTGSNSVDIWALGNTAWNRRTFIIKVTTVFVVVGVLIALLAAVEYKASATLLPEEKSQSSRASGLLEQYGGVIGLGGSNLDLDQQESISPELYPEIVNSIPYQLELLNEPITFARYDTTVSSYTFFKEVYSPSVFGYIKEYTIGLPGKIVGLFTPDDPPDPLPKGFPADSVVTLTKGQNAVVEKMKDRISVILDDDNGTIKLSVKMPDPKATADLGKVSIELLKNYVTDYRIRKATQDLEFTQEQMQKARQEFEEVQLRRAEFEDQNVGALTAKAETKRQRLESEYDLTFNKYSSLAQKVESAKLKVQEKTPTFSVLKPIQLPVDNFKPQRKLIVIISFIIGLLLSVGYVLSSEVLSSPKQNSGHF